MQALIDTLLANIVLVTLIQQGLFSALSAICELFKWTKASKVFGTLTSLDLGRVLRTIKSVSGAYKATIGSCLFLIFLPILILFGCSGVNQQNPLDCSIPSSVNKAQDVVSKIEDVAKDPSISTIAAAVGSVLDLLPSILPVSGEPSEQTKQIAKAKELLAKTEATIEDVCNAAVIAKALAPSIENVTDEKMRTALIGLSVVDEICK